MNLKKTILILAGLLLAGAANADPHHQGHHHGPFAVIKLFIGSPHGNLKANNEGSITPEIIQAARLAEFNAIRGDDYFVTLAEFQTGINNKVSARFAALDKDASSTLSLDEFTSGKSGEKAIIARNVFRVADANTDGFIDSAEFAKTAASVVSPLIPFVTLDTDGDGKVSEAEFTALPPHKGKFKGLRMYH